MNRSIQLLSLVFIAALAACTAKNDQDEWPEMDSFHTLMADSYHPLKDNGDLGPAKTKAADMAASAASWASASLPSKVDNDDVKARLDKLKADTQTFADKVKSNAPDSVLSRDLEQLHETFHAIMETWHKSGHDH